MGNSIRSQKFAAAASFVVLGVMIVASLVAAGAAKSAADRAELADIKRAAAERSLKAALAEVQEQKTRLDIIVATNQFPIIMCNEDSGITVTNQATEELFGWSREEMRGQSISILIPERLQEKHSAALALAAEEVAQKPGDWMLRKNVSSTAVDRHGREFDVELNIRAIKYAGKVEFITGIRKSREGATPPTESKPLPKPVIPTTPIPNTKKQSQATRLPNGSTASL